MGDLTAELADPARGAAPAWALARLEAARPRLLRLARARGVPAADADDVAQELAIAAWRRLDRLRDPARFDAWLDAICRNQCRMYLRARRACPGAAPPLVTDEAPEAGEAPDPQVAEPLEALARDDLARLLDRALGLLPAPARATVELRDLAELPEREAAARLGLSVGAFEARLHRARRQVRAALAGPLHAEAERLGLALAGAPPAGWRETRLWCNLCGRRRLLGAFVRRPDGCRELRLRCPDCSSRYDMDIYCSKGLAPLEDLRAFGPVLTRTMRALADRTRLTLATGRDVCLHCGAPVRRRVAGPDEVPPGISRALARHWVIAECPTPGCVGLGAWSAAEPAIWFHQDARRFMVEHPRWVKAPEAVATWAGRPALRFRLADATGRAELLLFADPRTLEILAAAPP